MSKSAMSIMTLWAVVTRKLFILPSSSTFIGCTSRAGQSPGLPTDPHGSVGSDLLLLCSIWAQLLQLRRPSMLPGLLRQDSRPYAFMQVCKWQASSRAACSGWD